MDSKKSKKSFKHTITKRTRRLLAAAGNLSGSSSSIQTGPKLFGSPFDDSRSGIPRVLMVAEAYFEVNGVDEEGVFRVSAEKPVLEELVRRMDRGDPVDIAQYDAHVMAAILKLYFRELPEPLIPYDLYDAFCSTARVGMEGEEATAVTAEKLHKLVPLLSKPRYDTLDHLLAILARVVSRQEVNMMGSANVAIVFAPNLLRPYAEDPEKELALIMKDTPLINRVMQVLIERHRDIFPGEDAALPKPQSRASRSTSDGDLRKAQQSAASASDGRDAEDRLLSNLHAHPVSQALQRGGERNSITLDNAALAKLHEMEEEREDNKRKSVFGIRLMFDEVQVGQSVWAQYNEDGMWYKAKVLSITSDGSFDVVFTDYGNEQLCRGDQVRPVDDAEGGDDAHANDADIAEFERDILSAQREAQALAGALEDGEEDGTRVEEEKAGAENDASAAHATEGQEEKQKDDVLVIGPSVHAGQESESFREPRAVSDNEDDDAAGAEAAGGASDSGTDDASPAEPKVPPRPPAVPAKPRALAAKKKLPAPSGTRQTPPKPPPKQKRPAKQLPKPPLPERAASPTPASSVAAPTTPETNSPQIPQRKEQPPLPATPVATEEAAPESITIYLCPLCTTEATSDEAPCVKCGGDVVGVAISMSELASVGGPSPAPPPRATKPALSSPPPKPSSSAGAWSRAEPGSPASPKSTLSRSQKIMRRPPPPSSSSPRPAAFSAGAQHNRTVEQPPRGARPAAMSENRNAAALAAFAAGRNYNANRQSIMPGSAVDLSGQQDDVDASRSPNKSPRLQQIRERFTKKAAKK